MCYETQQWMIFGDWISSNIRMVIIVYDSLRKCTTDMRVSSVSIFWFNAVRPRDGIVLFVFVYCCTCKFFVVIWRLKNEMIFGIIATILCAKGEIYFRITFINWAENDILQLDTCTQSKTQFTVAPNKSWKCRGLTLTLQFTKNTGSTFL